MRSYLAWQSIHAQEAELNLDEFQRREAKSKAEEFKRTVDARVLETWCWAMAPHQPDPQQPKIDWTITRVSGQEPLATRAGKRFVSDEALLTQFGARRLRAAIDQYDLWGGNDHIPIKTILDYFATYLYLPRLRNRELLSETIRSAISQLVPDQVAYADGFDDAMGRYLGLATTVGSLAVIDPAGLIVRAEAANARSEEPPGVVAPGSGEDRSPTDGEEPAPAFGPKLPRRFYASVAVDADRAGRDVGRIAAEVLQHLTTLRGAQVKVSLEIEAETPDGVPEDVQRIVTENCQTLKFTSQGFEDG